MFGTGVNVVTFDGSSYTIPEPCDYVLAMDCMEGSWLVYGKIAPGGCGDISQGGSLSCLEAVTLYAGREVVTLLRGWVVTQGYKASKITISEGKRVLSGRFIIDFDGLYLTITLRLEEYEVHVVWNGISSAFIRISNKGAFTCGLCGDNDGDPKNEMHHQNLLWHSGEQVVDANFFIRSWRVDSEKLCNQKTANKYYCPKDKYVEAMESCTSMFNNKVFRRCLRHLDSAHYLTACTQEACGVRGDNRLYDNQPEYTVPDTEHTATRTQYTVPGIQYTVPCQTGVLYLKMCELMQGEEVPATLHKLGCPSTRFIQEMATSLGCPQEELPYRN